MENRAVIFTWMNAVSCHIIDYLPLIIAWAITLIIGWIVFNRHDPP